MIKNILIIVQSKNKRSVNLAKKITNLYQDQTYFFSIWDITDKNKVSPVIDQQNQDVDLVLVIGGDGTMIRACRHFSNTNIPIIGINHGRLGFLVDLADHNIEKSLPDVLAGKFITNQRNMLAAKIFNSNHESKQEYTAVNEIFINRSNNSTMLDINIWDNQDFLIAMRADGIIVATPTGSTAYALSSGGPILHPQAQGFILCAVAPHSLTNRPIVLPDHFELNFELPKNKPKQKAKFFTDGQEIITIDINCKIKIYKSEQTFTLAHPINYNFYQNLRNKLSWNEELGDLNQ